LLRHRAAALILPKTEAASTTDKTRALGLDQHYHAALIATQPTRSELRVLRPADCPCLVHLVKVLGKVLLQVILQSGLAARSANQQLGPCESETELALVGNHHFRRPNTWLYFRMNLGRSTPGESADAGSTFPLFVPPILQDWCSAKSLLLEDLVWPVAAASPRLGGMPI